MYMLIYTDILVISLFLYPNIRIREEFQSVIVLCMCFVRLQFCMCFVLLLFGRVLSFAILLFSPFEMELKLTVILFILA